MRSVLKAQKRLYTTSLFSKAPSYSFSSFDGEHADVSTISSKSKSGSLNKILQGFENNNANFSHFESRSLENAFVSFEFEQTSRATQEIRHFNEEIGTPIVPWFPTKLSDLDSMGGNLIETDEVACKDHPQFTDREYRKRRDQIAENSKNTKMADPVPILDYLPSELGTWKTIFQKIVPIHEKLMCKQYLDCFNKLQKNCGLNENNIPQLRTLNEYLQTETQFRVKPVHGILSQREFLNALAFRVFCCTQYIRHHEFPFYTPEPDVVHEIIGHVPMFADKSFCDMSQMIGLLSLGASEEDLAKLASIYWYTVEFGVCREGDALKVFGAGIAPCVAELEHFMSDKAKFEDLDPKNLRYDYPLQDVQPVYMVAKSFDHAKAQLIEFGEHINRPFSAYYDLDKQEIKTDRKVKMRKPDEISKLF